jgi:hypothetical protein
MPALLCVLLAVVYMLSLTLALGTLRKDHHPLFWAGVIFPVLSIIEAAMAPTAHTEARHAAA